MSPQMRIVLEIAGAGMVLLFAALGALVSLMYLLTNPAVFGEPGREARRARRKARRLKKRAKTAPEAAGADRPAAEGAVPALAEARESRVDEHDRRRRAAALAVAIACARHDSAMVFADDTPSEWRALHRGLRLSQRIGRLKTAALTSSRGRTRS